MNKIDATHLKTQKRHITEKFQTSHLTMSSGGHFFYFMQIMLIELEMLPASREKRPSNITHSVDQDQPLLQSQS